jgi:hypothetical protein
MYMIRIHASFFLGCVFNDRLLYYIRIPESEDAARAWWIPLPDRSDHVGYSETMEFLKRCDFGVDEDPFV